MRITSLISSLLFSMTILGSSSAESKGFRGLMGNPAAEYCTDNRGTISTRLDENGNEWSLCTFPNGSACEEWDYSRGDCQVGEYVSFITFCRQNSGLYKAHHIDTTHVEGSQQGWYYTCQEQSGNICFEEDYYKGQCAAGRRLRELMGNPASTFCTDNGGTLEMQYDESGNEWSLCTFPNGSACEEWDYSRGDCQVGDYVSFSTYCHQNSGLTVYRAHHIDTTHVEGSPQQYYYTCQEQDGTVCFQEDYYKGKC